MIPRMLHDIPMWAKASAASVVLLLCLIGLGVNAYFTLDNSALGLTRLSAANLPKQYAVSSVTHDVITTHVKVFRYVSWASNSVSPNLLKSLNSEILDDLDLLKDRITCLALLPDLFAAERSKLDALAAKWKSYERTVRDTLDVGSTDAPMATMMLGATDSDFQKVAEELQGLSTLVTEHTKSVSEDLARKAQINKRVFMIGGTLGVLVSLLVTLFVGGSIVGPIRAVTQAMSRVSSGKTDVVIGYANRKDEIGQMVEAVATFRHNMEEQSRLLRQREEELSIRNLRFDTALNNMSGGLCFFDGAQRLIVCNNRYIEMYGLDPQRVRPGITLREIVKLRYEAGTFPAMSKEDYLAWRDRIAVTDKPSDSIVELKSGRIFEIHHRPMPDGGWVATHEDVTERQMLNVRLEQNLKLLGERTSLLQAIIDNFPGGIGFFDRDLRVVICNDRAKAILDLPERFFTEGPPLLEDILRFNAQRGEYGPGDVEQQVTTKLALAKDRTTYQFERERPDGTVLDVRGMPIDNGGFITIYMDITERYRSEAKIAHMARHDPLTGLSNRVLVNERLERALARVASGEIVAVHLLDLDRFKDVNDSMGHPAGDKLLRMVANRLRALTRETDTIARMGGDEFAIIQANIAASADATSLAQRAIEAVSLPYEIDGRHVVIGTSIGIASAPGDGLSPEELIKKADLALYGAKSNGRGTFCFFDPEMDAQMQTRHAMEIALRKALAADEFKLYYQPMVNLDEDEVRGFEALIRWHHPANGLVSPEDFMPLAEKTGLIIPIGEWTIREACAAAQRWPGDKRVAVNLSPAQFRSPGLRQAIVGALAASGLAPGRLELEINERALWEDMDAALDILYQLRALGVRISMDDFGTGNSSLSYLQSFPFDRIKIDRSFVKDVACGLGSLKIVRALATLAHGLGMAITVEGVENLEQLAAVKAEGCTEVQGYLFSRAVPSDDVERLFFPKLPRTDKQLSDAAA